LRVSHFRGSVQFWRVRILSKETVAQLSTLKYRPDAERKVSILPLGSIYWDDELPPPKKLVALPEADRKSVLRAFAIRFKLWDHQPLSDEDRTFWQRLHLLAPDWAIFRRLVLSEDDRRAREKAERECGRGFEELFASAYQVTVREEKHGLQSFSATFQLNKSQSDEPATHPHGAKLAKKPWWKFWG
jgi:hypothetical protein